MAITSHGYENLKFSQSDLGKIKSPFEVKTKTFHKTQSEAKLQHYFNEVQNLVLSAAKNVQTAHVKLWH